MAGLYLHEVSERKIVDGKKYVHEESVIHGDKGLTIKLYHKEGENATKVIVVKKGDGYLMKVMADGKTDEKTLSKDDLIKELKKDKQLKFAVEYVEKAKNLSRTKRSSKKGSKKGSKKASKKGSKKGSRKH